MTYKDGDSIKSYLILYTLYMYFLNQQQQKNWGGFLIMQYTSVTPWHTYFHYIPNNFSSKHSLQFKNKKTLINYTNSCHQEQEKHNNNSEKTERQKHVYWQEMSFSVEKEKPHYKNDAKEQGVEVTARSGIRSNSWWARVKAALGQRINLEGIFFAVRIFYKDKHLAIPHVFVQDMRCIDWAELKKRGFEGVVFDKDNTITVPYSLNLWSPLASSMEQCKSLFGNNIAVFSNSAGLVEYDPDGRKARILERAIGIKVIRHRLKKPAGTAEEIERQFHCKSSRLIMVGDRHFTDIAYGNRNGFLTILSAPLSPSQEPFIVKLVRLLKLAFLDVSDKTFLFILFNDLLVALLLWHHVRKLEMALVKRWSSKGIKPISHWLLPDCRHCIKDELP